MATVRGEGASFSSGAPGAGSALASAPASLVVGFELPSSDEQQAFPILTTVGSAGLHSQWVPVAVVVGTPARRRAILLWLVGALRPQPPRALLAASKRAAVQYCAGRKGGCGWKNWKIEHGTGS